MLSFLKADFKIIFFSAVLVYFTGHAWAVDQPVLYKGIITAQKLNIRKGPSQKAGVLVVVDKGQTVNVISPAGPVGSWLTIDYNNQTGYVRNRERYIRLYPVKNNTRPVHQAATPKKQAVSSTKQSKAPGADEHQIQKKKIEKKNQQAQAHTSEKQPPANQSREIQKKIINQKRLVQTFTQKEREIIEGLNEIDYALNKARLKVKSLSAEMQEIEEEIARLKQDKTRLKKAIDNDQAYAGMRLRALYKMNMIGRLDVAGMPASIFDFFVQQNAMKQIIETDFQVIDQQNTDFENLQSLEGKLQNDMQTKAALEARLTDQIRINKSETLKKELILKDIQKKKRLSLAAVESLKDAQIRLDNQIQALETGLEPGQNKLSFASYKGRLNFPVNGKIISDFGPSRTRDDKSFTFQKGIDIKVERGEPVKTVFKGKVIFARWLKGYGNMVIIDHGDNYYTLYAHLEEMFKQKGETVEKGDVIATAGDTGSIKGMCLHFEVRHHGKPVNPMQWLQKGA
jgi:murein DD-endopeptidase MepM/ murein hydrolase activator NlpD